MHSSVGPLGVRAWPITYGRMGTFAADVLLLSLQLYVALYVRINYASTTR